jgi:hypothetical protein
MKRWILVACLILIPALGLLVPAGAQASTAATTNLTSGKPVKATISKSGQTIKYTFAATANQNVTFQVTNFDFTVSGSSGEVQLQFYEPGTSSEYPPYPSCDLTGDSYCNFTPSETGTWSMDLVPISGAVGSLTLTFADDVASQALTSGKAVSTTINFEGQEGGYTFAASANKNVTFQVTRFNFTASGSSGEVQLQFYPPGSSSEYPPYPSCNLTADSYCNFTPGADVGGTWSIKLVPISGAVGSLTLTFADNVATQALTSGKAVTTTINFEGQDAGYTFAATANKNVTFQVTDFDFTADGSSGEVQLQFYEPDTSNEDTACNFTASGTCTVKTLVGGTWSITLVPISGATGSLTLKLT